MTISVKEIQELKTYLVDTYHAKRVKEQEEDETYRLDTFTVPFVPSAEWIVRTGKGARMIDGPAEHIITSNPQVFRKPIKDTKADAERTLKVAAELNRWAKVLLRQNPQPYKEFVKKLLGRGEAWLYVIHNQAFNQDDDTDMPLEYILLDPLVTFLDPEGGEKDGIPGRVIVYYERLGSTINRNYPGWTWPRRDYKQSDKVPFFMYWDSRVRYFEADKEALLRDGKNEIANGDGIQENIYGVVPLVHSYSGFGTSSPDGDPAYLAVGRLRYVRHLLGEQAAIRSVLNTLVHKYAHKPIDLIYDASSGQSPTGNIGEKYSRELNAFNVIGLPTGGKIEAGIDMLPDKSLYDHLYTIEAQIDRDDPLSTVPGGIGTSGRQQDMATEASLRRYDTIVENTAHSFATAFGLGLRILGKLPDTYMPKSLSKEDIQGRYDCEIELKVADPIEHDRRSKLGEALFMNGEIDLETNLIDYQGYTQERTKEIMAKILVDNATRNNPIIAEIMGRQLAKEAGMEQEYESIKAQLNANEKPLPTMPDFGSEGGEPRTGNIKTPLGMEQADMSLMTKGVRRSPVA